MEKHGRTMKVDSDATRRLLAGAGFAAIEETIINVGCRAWSQDPHERTVASWFNSALCTGLEALSYRPMREVLKIQEDEIDKLCAEARQELCASPDHISCRLYVTPARRS